MIATTHTSNRNLFVLLLKRYFSLNFFATARVAVAGVVAAAVVVVAVANTVVEEVCLILLVNPPVNWSMWTQSAADTATITSI